MIRGQLARDALTLRAMHSPLLISGARRVCRCCGPAYPWPCARFLRAHAVWCMVRGRAQVITRAADGGGDGSTVAGGSSAAQPVNMTPSITNGAGW